MVLFFKNGWVRLKGKLYYHQLLKMYLLNEMYYYSISFSTVCVRDYSFQVLFVVHYTCWYKL